MKMKYLFIAAAMLGLAATQAAAETATNTINGVTNSVSGAYYVGNTGPFNGLIITNAGLLYGSSISYLGNGAGSSNNTALVTGTDSTWTNSNLVVGYSGAGNQLSIQNGGLVFAAMDYVGYSSSSIGNTLLVTGGNSRFVSSSDLQFGVSGGGNQMTISGAGLVSVAGTGYIGYNGGSSNNAVLVTGNNSVWSNASLIVGLGSSGNSLTLTNNGAVSVSANTVIGSYAGTANNSLNLNGGTFTAGGLLEVRNGAFNLSGGNLTTLGTLLVTNNTASATNAFFNFNCGTLTTYGAQLTAPSGGAIAIGNTAGQTATWNILGGTNALSGHAALGNAAGAQANVLVSGASTLWNNSGNLYAGYASGANNSTLTITNGAQVKNVDGYVGYAFGTGNNTVLVTGSGSVWTNTGALTLGYGANANNNQLSILNGAQVSGFNGTIGLDGADNSVLISDANSQWKLNYDHITPGNFVVGDRTSGNQVTVTNGGLLVTDQAFTHIIGNSSTANSNTVLITGSGSKFKIPDADHTYIGMSGSGNSLVVRDGGSVPSLGQGVTVGHDSTANNNSIVVDGGMAASIIDLYIGYDGSGNSLTITNGGSYTNNNGGSLSSPQFHLGYNAGSSNNFVTVTGPGSLLAVATIRYHNKMWVGESGSGNSLTVAAGGQVTVVNSGTNNDCLFSIGKNAGANNNAVTVTDSNSLIAVSGDFYVGESGSGNSLTIASGGVVSNALGRYIGFNNNSANNAVTITGAGSQWINTNNLYVGYGIGASGNQLTLSNGGQLTNLPALYVGYGSGASNSQVTVSSGSLLQISSGVDIGNGGGNNNTLVTGGNTVWNNAGGLTIGSGSGGNQFTVSDGGAVSNASTSVGNGGGNNSLLVTDSNSVWKSAGDMVIGNGTAGSMLTISNGAQVAAGGKNVIGTGFSANNNSVTVSGGGSVWTNASDLNVGASGQNNSLTISDGALVANAGIGYTSFGGGSGNSVLVTGSNSTWNVGSWLQLGGTDHLTISGTGAVVRVGSDLSFGGFGNQLTVTNGGRLFDTRFRGQDDSARILITGSGSVWANSGTFAFRNGHIDNQLTIAQGGVVFNGSATIGGSSFYNYNNYILVTDPGSQWNIAGDFTMFGAHDQGVTVSNSGAVAISGNINLGTNGDLRVAITVADGSLIATNAGAGILRLNSGELNLNGGTLNVNQLNATNSAVNLNSGTLTTYGVQIVAPDGSNLAIGNTAGQTATVNILGGTNSIAPPSGYNTVLGSVAGAQASVLLTGPGTVLTNTGNLYLGHAAGASNSQVTITNGAQLINNNVLIVGYSGSGSQLAIQDGGKVDNGFYGFVGYNASASNNSVLVTGPGSFWNSRSDLKLGSSGSGNQMIIANGGSVRVAGTTYVGYDASAGKNTILVTGSGSTWTNTGNLNVGFGGFGNQMTIAAGGAVFNVNGNLGGASSNAVTITGSGSAWHNSGTLTLANGTLTLAQGAVMANQYTQNAGGTLAFQLGGTPANGVLAVSGPAQLGGPLTVTNLNGFQPALSNAFTLVTAASVSGTFAATNLPPLGAGLSWQLTYAPTSVVLSVVSAAGPLSALKFTANPVISGTTLTISATNTGAGTVYLLTSTNVAAPRSTWTPIWTNILTGDGSFTTNLSNAVNPALNHQFYLLGNTNNY